MLFLKSHFFFSRVLGLLFGEFLDFCAFWFVGFSLVLFVDMRLNCSNCES